MIGYELTLKANIEISAYRGYLDAIRSEKKLLDTFRITLYYGNVGVLKFSPSDLKIENIDEILDINFYEEFLDDEEETISMFIVGNLSLSTDDYKIIKEIKSEFEKATIEIDSNLNATINEYEVTIE